MKLVNVLSVSAIALNLVACGQGVTNSSSSPGGVGIVNGDPVSLLRDEPAQHVVELKFLVKPAPGVVLPPGRVQIATCTGTIVSDSIVLTAAHCADFDFDKAVVIFSTSEKVATQQDVRPIIAKSVNKAWQPTKLSSPDIGDTALVKFAGGLPQGYTPAEILTDSSALTAGTEVLEMGYGIAFPTEQDKGVGTLRQATVAILDSTTAKTEIVTDESHGQGVCEGDSGGPSFVNVNGKYLLWGVASRVAGNAPDPNAAPGAEQVVLCNQISVETNIVPYLGWLKTEMAKLDAINPSGSNQVASVQSAVQSL